MTVASFRDGFEAQREAAVLPHQGVSAAAVGSGCHGSVTRMPAPVSLAAEILTDADTGRPELVITSGDSVEVGSPEDLRQQIEAAQMQLMKLTALADQYEAISATTSPCFSWCSHDGRFPGEHESAAAQLPTPHGMQVAYGELLKAHLYHGDEWGVTQVSVNSQGNGVVLNPAQAAEFADHMESMAARVREMARLAARG